MSKKKEYVFTEFFAKQRKSEQSGSLRKRWESMILGKKIEKVFRKIFLAELGQNLVELYERNAKVEA